MFGGGLVLVVVQKILIQMYAKTFMSEIQSGVKPDDIDFKSLKSKDI